MVPLHIIIPVWGEAYTRGFIEIGLPSRVSQWKRPPAWQSPEITYAILLRQRRLGQTIIFCVIF